MYAKTDERMEPLDDMECAGLLLFTKNPQEPPKEVKGEKEVTSHCLMSNAKNETSKSKRIVTFTSSAKTVLAQREFSSDDVESTLDTTEDKQYVGRENTESKERTWKCKMFGRSLGLACIVIAATIVRFLTTPTTLSSAMISPETPNLESFSAPPLDSVASLSHVGESILSELSNTKEQLPHEGRGKTWDLDLRAQTSQPSNMNTKTGQTSDWFMYTPRQYIGSDQLLSMARTCNSDKSPGGAGMPNKGIQCDRDFQVTDCTRGGQALCDRPKVCEVPCDVWQKTNGLEECVVPKMPKWIASTEDDYICSRQCCPDEFIEVARARSVCKTVAATQSHPQKIPKKLCTGHSDDFVDKIYYLVRSAEAFVDIHTLYYPDGRFLAGVRNAITYLHNIGKNVQIRVLLGIHGWEYGVQGLLDELTRDLPSFESTVTVSVGYWIKFYPMQATQLIHGLYSAASNGMSFNHAKFIAIDGRTVMTGGHNMRTGIYLLSSPILDISMMLSGPVVGSSAHQFANEQWQWICDQTKGRGQRRSLLENEQKGTGMGLAFSHYSSFPPSKQCPKKFLSTEMPPMEENRKEESASTEKKPSAIFTIGRLGGLSSDPPNLSHGQTSDRAIIAFLRSAQESIYMSQQDIGPPLPVDEKKKLGFDMVKYWSNYWGESWVMVELARALRRGVEIHLVLSQLRAPGYGYGWTIDDVRYMMKLYLRNHLHGSGMEEIDVEKRVEENFKIAQLGYRPNVTEWLPSERCPRTWYDDAAEVFSCHGNESRALGSHAKFIAVDEQAYYIGSQNAYISPLNQWGVIIDDRESTEQVLDEFWYPHWNGSQVGR